MRDGDDEQYGGLGEMGQLSQHGRGDEGQHHEVGEIRRVHTVSGRVALLSVRAVHQLFRVRPAGDLGKIQRTLSTEQNDMPRR